MEIVNWDNIQTQKDRIIFVIEQEAEGKTLREVGEALNLTRERVRQIFKKSTGKRWGRTRRLFGEIKRNERVAKLLTEVYGECPQCGKGLTRVEVGRVQRFCTEKCRGLWFRRNRSKLNICDNCGKKFHPFRCTGFPSQRGTGAYCSRECYQHHKPVWNGTRQKNCELCGVDLGKVRYSQKYCKPCRKQVTKERQQRIDARKSVNKDYLETRRKYQRDYYRRHKWAMAYINYGIKEGAWEAEMFEGWSRKQLVAFAEEQIDRGEMLAQKE